MPVRAGSWPPKLCGSAPARCRPGIMSIVAAEDRGIAGAAHGVGVLPKTVWAICRNPRERFTEDLQRLCGCPYAVDGGCRFPHLRSRRGHRLARCRREEVVSGILAGGVGRDETTKSTSPASEGAGLASLLLTVAEDRRFELLRGCLQHAFQACALGH